MYWMKLRDILQLQSAEQLRDSRTTKDSIARLKESIDSVGWQEESGITIADNKITGGLIRVQALKELLSEGHIDSDLMISVELYRTMWVQQLVKL